MTLQAGAVFLYGNGGEKKARPKGAAFGLPFRSRALSGATLVCYSLSIFMPPPSGTRESGRKGASAWMKTSAHLSLWTPENCKERERDAMRSGGERPYSRSTTRERDSIRQGRDCLTFSVGPVASSAIGRFFFSNGFRIRPK